MDCGRWGMDASEQDLRNGSVGGMSDIFVVLLRPWYEMKIESGAGSIQFDTKNPLWHSRNTTNLDESTSLTTSLEYIRSERQYVEREIVACLDEIRVLSPARRKHCGTVFSLEACNASNQRATSL